MTKEQIEEYEWVGYLPGFVAGWSAVCLDLYEDGQLTKDVWAEEAGVSVNELSFTPIIPGFKNKHEKRGYELGVTEGRFFMLVRLYQNKRITKRIAVKYSGFTLKHWNALYQEHCNLVEEIKKS